MTAERALPIAERLDLVEQIAEAIGVKGAALATLGRRVEGLGLLQIGSDLAEANSLPLLAARFLGNRGAYLLGDPRAALAVERAAIEISVRLGQRTLQMTNIQNAAEDAIRTGEWDWSINLLEASLGDDLDAVDRASILLALIRYRLYRGQAVDEARIEVQRLAAEIGDTEFEAGLMGVAADAALAAGDPRAARASARGAAAASVLNAPLQYLVAARAATWCLDPGAIAEDLAALDATNVKGPALDLNRTAARAGIAALEGDASTAHRLFGEALRGVRDLGLPWDEALIAIDMAMTLDPTDAEVAAAVAAGRSILESLGATPMLAILDGAASRETARQPAGSDLARTMERTTPA